MTRAPLNTDGTLGAPIADGDTRPLCRACVDEIDRRKAERAAVIGPYATNVTDHVAVDGSNNIAVSADVHDMAGLEAMLASPPADIAAQMERHGVIPPFTAYFEK